MNRRPVILVADDSEDIRNPLDVMLKESYDVKFAFNSGETLAAADTDPLPDLILLDVEMPELNGYEVCARLKANPSLARIPVIFVTARSDPKDQARGLLAGGVDYITKPISAPIALLRVVVAAFIKVVKELDAVRAEYKDELEGTHNLDFAPAAAKKK